MPTSRRTWLAACCTAAAASALAIPALAHASPSLRHHQSHRAKHSARFYARARRVALRSLRDALAPNMPAGPARSTRIANVSQSSSYNWAGYAATSTTAGFFTRVSGKWTIPAVTCTPEDRIASVWVGLDGATNRTVEQLGTVSQCFEGTAVYYTWYEMYPAASVLESQAVQAGDVISASAARSGTNYTLKLSDATRTGSNFSVLQSCAAATCTDESAEWIVERPSYSIGATPLAQFGTPIAISATSATGGGTTGTPSHFTSLYDIAMDDATQSYDLATPSVIGTGSSFRTTWLNSW